MLVGNGALMIASIEMPARCAPAALEQKTAPATAIANAMFERWRREVMRGSPEEVRAA